LAKSRETPQNVDINSMKETNEKLKKIYDDLLDDKISIEDFWKELLPFMRKMRESGNLITAQKAQAYGLQLINLSEKVSTYRKENDIGGTSQASEIKKEIMQLSWSYLMSVDEVLSPFIPRTPPGNDEEVNEEVEKLIERIRNDPNNSIGYNALGNYYFSKKRYDEAITQYNQAISKDSTKHVYYANIGEAYWAKGNLNQASLSYETALRLDPDDDINNDKLGQIYLLKGQLDEAIERFQKAISKNSNPGYLIDIGDAHLQKKEWDLAIDYYQEAITINPEDFIAHSAIANAYMSRFNLPSNRDLGLLNKAIDHYKKSIEIEEKNNLVAYTGLGDIYISRGDWDAAIENYRKALEINATDNTTINNIGFAYLRKEEYGRALDFFNQALANNPRSSLTLRYLGDYYSQLEKYDEAITNYKSAIDIDPRNAAASYSLGRLYILKRQPELALRYYIDATTIEPDNYIYQSELGYLYTKLNPPQWHNAKKALQRAIEINNKDDLSYIGLGDVFFGMGLFTQALEKYKEAISLNPNNPEYYAIASNTYIRLRIWGEALEYAKMADRKAREIKSSDDRYMHYIALVYHERGLFYFDQQQYDIAIAEFREAIKYKEFDTTYWVLYLSYYALNRFHDARQSLNKAKEVFRRKNNRDKEEYIDALQDPKLS
jgi:tetratricopeptide (TPR) repeat protein